LPVASCVSRDYTLTVRSLRVTAGRRAALCEERRRIEAGKKILKVPYAAVLLIQCCGSGSKIRCLFDPCIRYPGWVKSQDPDPYPGWKKIKIRIRDPGWKNSDPGWKNSDPGWKKFGSWMEKIRIRDPG
jgi:hypothetical protein